MKLENFWKPKHEIQMLSLQPASISLVGPLLDNWSFFLIRIHTR